MSAAASLWLLLAAAPILAVGDVAADRAVLWMEAPGASSLDIGIETLSGPEAESRTGFRLPGGPVFKRTLEGLRPGTAYAVTACRAEWCATARFTTAPDPREPAAVRLAFSGDLAGQNACRDSERGFPVFSAMREASPDFFVALGDMIYADAECRPTGRFGNAQVSGPAVAGTYAEFAAHWSYTRADPAFRRLLEGTALYAVWDDHEVVNDFSRHAAVRDGADLFEPGRRAMLDYNPIDRGAGRLYGRFRIGGHLELFLLDTRSYRDDKAREDESGKTLLGQGQRDWLIDSVTASDATWKVIATSVPLSIPTGTPAGEGRDGWADGGEPTGYERELFRILEAFADAGERNLVWLSADVHFATVLSHSPFPDHPEFTMIEAVAGPLSAGLFPHSELDASLQPRRLFLHGPEGPDRELDFAASLEWMNFGLLDVSEQGGLILRYVNGAGREIFRLELPPGR